MGAHRGRIQEHATRSSEGLSLQIFPEPWPDAAGLPAPKTHVDRVPVTEGRRQIAPRAAGALQMEERFEELAIGHLAGRAGRGMFGRGQRDFELRPKGVADDFPHGMFEHPKFQAKPSTIVHTIIREHCLARD